MDLMARLQRLPVGRFHYRLLVLLGLGWLFDAMDTGMVSFVLPLLGKEWALSPQSLAWVVSSGFVGMALGAVSSGWIADKFGRKNVFATTMIVYSVATGLCAAAWDMGSLLFFRFWVGFGLGGQLPVAVSLLSEYAPPQVRGRLIVLLESFWGLGWLVAAAVSYFVIPSWGWQGAFAVGALPIVYAFWVWKRLPESVPYLVANGKLEQAHQWVSQLERAAGINPCDMPVAMAQSVNKVGFALLWQPSFVRRTVMLWIVWFGIVFSYYGIFTWLPKLLVEQGYTVVKSFEYVLLMIVAQLPGYVVAAVLVEKWGRKTTLSVFLAACAVCAYGFGQSSSVAGVMIWGCLMSFFNLGAWGVVYTYTPELYPVRFRAFASGWAAAVGRVGGIVAPLAVAVMLDNQQDLNGIFVMFAVVMGIVVLAVLCLGEETKGRSLEEINR